jgi:hypothetical protein
MRTDPLRNLLDELQQADTDRQRIPRDSPEYGYATERVDRLVREVWDAAVDDELRSPAPGDRPAREL